MAARMDGGLLISDDFGLCKVLVDFIKHGDDYLLEINLMIS